MAARARAAEPLAPSNDGADIAAAIGAARDKLGRLDTAGALAGLKAKRAEEEAARRQRLKPLLREQAAIERLTYDHAAAMATLRDLQALDPDDPWPSIEIGDLHVTTGALAPALAACRDALDIADPGNAEWQRDLIVSCVKLAEAAPQEARAWLTRALGIARDLAASGRLAPADAWMPADLERRLAALGD